MRTNFRIIAVRALAMLHWSSTLQAQMIDNTQAPNIAKAGINKSPPDEIGFGQLLDGLPSPQERAISSAFIDLVHRWT
jgi:hypothetical protein